MVTILPQEDRTGGAGFGAGLAKGISGGIDEALTRRRDQQEDEALQRLLTKRPENDTAEGIMSDILGAKVSQGAKKRAFENFLGAEKINQTRKNAAIEADKLRVKKKEIKAKSEIDLLKETNRAKEKASEKESIENKDIKKKEQDIQTVKSLVQTLDLDEETKKNLIEANDVQTVRELAKNQLKHKDIKPSVGENALAKTNTENFLRLSQELPKIENSISDISRIEELVDKLGIPGLRKLTGPIEGYIGTATSAEIEDLGFTLLQPIIKIFNPTGPIAAKKLEQIRDVFQIRPTDNGWRIKGKINATKRLANRAKQLAEEELKFYADYDGNPPAKALVEFHTRKQESLDNELRKGRSIVENTEAEKNVVNEEVESVLPSAGKYKGKQIKSPKGDIYISNGVIWTKK